MLRFFVFLVCIVSISSVHAGVVEMDLSTPGDGLLTCDTINKRAWLDLPETGGLELSEVLAQMEPGGRLAGFQFAMLEDVTALAASAGVNWMEAWTLSGTTGDHIYGFASQLGWIIQMTGGILGEVNIVLGQIASDLTDDIPLFDNTNFYVMSIGVWLDPNVYKPPLYARPAGGVFTAGPVSLSNFPDLPPMGTGDIGPFWLYRAVPEPSSVALLMMGCVAVVGRGARCEHRG